MTRRLAPSSRVWLAAAIALAIGAVIFLIWWLTSPKPADVAPAPKKAELEISGPEFPRGGKLTGLLPAAPFGFNPDEAGSEQQDALARLTQSTLVRVNRSTGQLNPWLAESWTASGDNLIYTLELRPNILWSDGVPFTAADVVFTLRAAYDAQSPDSLWTLMLDGGKPLAARPVDPLTVEITFPPPFTVGLRLLDTLPVLPRHKLEQPLAAGTFAKAWGLHTPPEEMAGLGPFVLNNNAGATLTFVRNPHYWRNAPDGKPLPYLDTLTLQVSPDQNTLVGSLLEQRLNLIDVDLPTAGIAALKKADEEGKARLYDLGPGLDGDALWFNLAAPPHPPYQAHPAHPAWLLDDFRLAVSTAVNRRTFCGQVYLGGCDPIFGPVTPGNAGYFLADLPVAAPSEATARQLLAGLGLLDRDADGTLDDEQGRPVRFTLLVARGKGGIDDVKEHGAAFVRDELKKVGIGVDLVSLDAAAIKTRWQKGDYDAIYDRLPTRDTDPALSLDFWLSAGRAHMWNPGQPRPATDWERQIDEMMLKQVGTTDRVQRVQLFADVQKIFAKHMPAIYFGAPYVFAATSMRVRNAAPSRQRPSLLWSADTLAAAP